MLDIAGFRLTGWQPDTCGCYLKILWDDRDSAEERRHVCIEATACPAHQADDPQAVFDAAAAHNRAVNEERNAAAQEGAVDVG